MAENKEFWNDLTQLFERNDGELWLEKVREDLRGKDLSTLSWTAPGGVTVRPFYTAADLENVSGTPGTAGSWHIIERIPVRDAAVANRRALELLENGSESIVYDLQHQPLSRETASALLEGIYTDMAPVAFTGYGSMEVFPDLPEGVTLLDDRLLYTLRTDTFPATAGAFREAWLPFLTAGRDGIRRFTIDAAPFKEAGADHVQELAYTLAEAHEYFHLTEKDAPLQVRIRMAVSGNFFFEIAKLRAFRKLWRVLCSSHFEEPVPVYLEAASAKINKSCLDSHTNMLRNTAECMAAVLGGADGIEVAGHMPGREDPNARRWSSNISRLLRYESFFGDAGDAASGSYYLESLTDDLADKAWEAFRKIEHDGGFITSWQNGSVESAVQERLTDKRRAVAHREAVLIGVNDYPDLAGRITWPDNAAAPNPFKHLPPARLAAPFEHIRKLSIDHREAGRRLPKIALIRTGKPANAAARINYAANFMACAGWDSSELDMEQIDGISADLAVLCSDNDAWPRAIETVRSAFDGRLLLAGNPADLPETSRSRINGAIYTGCNVQDTLQQLQKELLV